MGIMSQPAKIKGKIWILSSIIAFLISVQHTHHPPHTHTVWSTRTWSFTQLHSAPLDSPVCTHHSVRAFHLQAPAFMSIGCALWDQGRPFCRCTRRTVCASDAFVRVGALFIIRKRGKGSLSLHLSRIHRYTHTQMAGFIFIAAPGSHGVGMQIRARAHPPWAPCSLCVWPWLMRCANHGTMWPRHRSNTRGSVYFITHVPPLPLPIPNHHLLC